MCGCASRPLRACSGPSAAPTTAWSSFTSTPRASRSPSPTPPSTSVRTRPDRHRPPTCASCSRTSLSTAARRDSPSKLTTTPTTASIRGPGPTRSSRATSTRTEPTAQHPRKARRGCHRQPRLCSAAWRRPGPRRGRVLRAHADNNEEAGSRSKEETGSRKQERGAGWRPLLGWWHGGRGRLASGRLLLAGLRSCRLVALVRAALGLRLRGPFLGQHVLVLPGLGQGGQRLVEQLHALAVVELALVVLAQVGVEPGQLGTDHAAGALALARLEVLLGLAPVGVAQRQAAQGEQQVRVVGPLLQPLLGGDQLTRGVHVEQAVAQHQAAVPALLEGVAQQPLGDGLLAAAHQRLGVEHDQLDVAAQVVRHVGPEATHLLDIGALAGLAPDQLAVGALLELVALLPGDQLLGAQPRHQATQAVPVADAEVGLLELLEHLGVVGELAVQAGEDGQGLLVLLAVEQQ